MTSKLKSAVVYSAVGTYALQFLNFATIVIISRLLTPTEIGVFAVASSAILVASELRNLGVVQYLIKERDIDETKIRTVLGTATLVSWSLGGIIILSAGKIADFYKEPDLTTILLLLSITYFIGPFTSVPIALWRRNLQFKQVFIQKVIGALVSAVSMLSLIYLDFSYYGLAIGVILGLIAELIVAVLLKPEGTVWIPRFRWIKDLVIFGLLTSSTNLFTRLSESIPDLVIGRVGSMADVGQFSRGFGAILFLNRIIVQAVSPVVLPYLSGVKHSGESIPHAYLRATNLLLAVSWPVMAVANAAAYPMINALFGAQWVDAVSITSILALWAIFASVHSFGNSALIVAGAERSMFLVGGLVTFFRFTAVVLSARISLDAAAWALVVTGMLEFILITLILKKAIHLTIRHLFLILLPNSFIAVGCWLVTYILDQIIDFETSHPWYSIAIIAVILPVVWIFLIRATRHEIWDILIKSLNLKIKGRSIKS